MKRKIDVIFYSFKIVFSSAPLETIIVVLGQIINGFIPSVITMVIAKLIDSMSMDIIGDSVVYALFFIAAYLLKYMVEFIFSFALNSGVYEKVTVNLRIRLCEKISRLKFIDYENSELMDMRKRATEVVDTEKISTVFNSFMIMVNSIALIISMSVVLSIYDYRLMLLSIISVCPYFFILIIRGREFYKIQWMQTPQKRILNYIWGLFVDEARVKEMRVLNFDKYIYEKWRLIRNDINEKTINQNIKEAKSILFCDVIKTLGYCLSVLLTIRLTYNGIVTIGVFSACINAFSALQETMRQILIRSAAFSTYYSEVQDYISFMELAEEKQGDVVYKGLKKGITVKNVTFSYPNKEKATLNNISMKIKSGETWSFVGENGSGKTTLSRVILGLYSPREGDVKYDDIPISEFNKETLNNSVISQDFVQYKLPICESIALEDNPDSFRVMRLLQDVGLNELDEKGVDIQIGKEFGGIELSLGQYQRIAIARSLYHDSDLIVLDEPTASLDPITETEILKEFVKIAKQKTAIIITHRIGICQFTDKIAVMDKGYIVESGTHTELMERQGKYFEMYNSQGKWYR